MMALYYKLKVMKHSRQNSGKNGTLCLLFKINIEKQFNADQSIQTIIQKISKSFNENLNNVPSKNST